MPGTAPLRLYDVTINGTRARLWLHDDDALMYGDNARLVVDTEPVMDTEPVKGRTPDNKSRTPRDK